MNPQDWLEFVTSAAFGILSAILPVANAEAYVVMSQASAVAGPMTVAVGVGIGQSIGKLLLFLGVRRGKDFRFVRKHRREARAVEVGPVRQRFRRFIAKLLALVGTKRWGLPITFLAAVAGLPPLYAVALLAGATKMRAIWFYLVVLAGRVIRFVAVAMGVGGFFLH